jgi:hypothetical protein
LSLEILLLLEDFDKKFVLIHFEQAFRLMGIPMYELADTKATSPVASGLN